MIIRKDFAKALLFWLFFGAIGAHRIYITERMHFILWYFIVNACTFGILAIVDLFLLKGMIDKKFTEDKAMEQYKFNTVINKTTE
jgi:TM2 domain-containing membrane protein YozV